MSIAYFKIFLKIHPIRCAHSFQAFILTLANPRHIHRAYQTMSLQTSRLSHKLLKCTHENLFWDLFSCSTMYHCIGDASWFCTSIFRTIWQPKFGFACSFLLLSEGLLVIMFENKGAHIYRLWTQPTWTPEQTRPASSLQSFWTRTHQYMLWLPSLSHLNQDLEAAQSTGSHRDLQR